MHPFRNLQEPESTDITTYPGYVNLSDVNRKKVSETYYNVFNNNQGKLGIKIAQGIAYATAKQMCEGFDAAPGTIADEAGDGKVDKTISKPGPTYEGDAENFQDKNDALVGMTETEEGVISAANPEEDGAARQLRLNHDKFCMGCNAVHPMDVPCFNGRKHSEMEGGAGAILKQNHTQKGMDNDPNRAKDVHDNMFMAHEEADPVIMATARYLTNRAKISGLMEGADDIQKKNLKDKCKNCGACCVDGKCKSCDPETASDMKKKDTGGGKPEDIEYDASGEPKKPVDEGLRPKSGKISPRVGAALKKFANPAMKEDEIPEEHIGWGPMVKKLKKSGHSEESADKIAGAINAKKHHLGKFAEEEIQESASCPDCGSGKVSFHPYDFGKESQTGYHDAGERYTCGKCGSKGDAEDCAPRKKKMHEEVDSILAEAKETLWTENFYPAKPLEECCGNCSHPKSFHESDGCATCGDCQKFVKESVSFEESEKKHKMCFCGHEFGHHSKGGCKECKHSGYVKPEKAAHQFKIGGERMKLEAEELAAKMEAEFAEIFAAQQGKMYTSKANASLNWLPEELELQEGKGYEDIGPGDHVKFNHPLRGSDKVPQQGKGKVVMKGPAGWVVNMGGKHGTPGIVSKDNYVSHRKAAKKMTEDEIQEASYISPGTRCSECGATKADHTKRKAGPGFAVCKKFTLSSEDGGRPERRKAQYVYGGVKEDAQPTAASKAWAATEKARNSQSEVDHRAAEKAHRNAAESVHARTAAKEHKDQADVHKYLADFTKKHGAKWTKHQPQTMKEDEICEGDIHYQVEPGHPSKNHNGEKSLPAKKKKKGPSLASMKHQAMLDMGLKCYRNASGTRCYEAENGASITEDELTVEGLTDFFKRKSVEKRTGKALKNFVAKSVPVKKPAVKEADDQLLDKLMPSAPKTPEMPAGGGGGEAVGGAEAGEEAATLVASYDPWVGAGLKYINSEIARNNGGKK